MMYHYTKSVLIKAFVIAFFSLTASGILVGTAQAADPKLTIRDSGLSVQYVSQSIPDPIRIEAGKTQTVTVRFKNTGTQPLLSLNAHKDGYKHVSAYTMEPRDRNSAFKGSNWLSAKQTASIVKDTKPGEIAELAIQLTAPTTPGTYKEEFYLAAENWSWIKGGYFYFDITVVPASSAAPLPAVSTPPPGSDAVASPVAESKPVARIITQKAKEVTVHGGDAVPFILVYRNKGGQPWRNYTLHAAPSASLASVGSDISFADTNWQGSTTVKTQEKLVTPEEIFREEFTFRAPSQKGDYVLSFFLASDGSEIEGSQTHVNVHVTENAPYNYAPPTFSTDTSVTPPSVRLSAEPRIRVGLAAEGSTVQIVSYDDDYRIYDIDNEVGLLPKSSIAIITHTGDGYILRAAGITYTSAAYFRFVPVNNPHAVFTVMKGLKDRKVAWVGPSEFLRYRGAYEFRIGQVDNELYVVNDVLLEDYVEGIAETGKGIASEAVKANLVAARTYAYTSRGKYPFFDVLGSTYDQLYLGDDVSKYLVDVKSAAKATRGQMVTYQGTVVMTPYFGNSDGKTRSWSSVWGGSEKSWLVSIVAKYDAGRSRFGHGVGMSQRDAALRAKNDGWTSDQLLTYYYSGTQVETMYR